jgi:hypothetical protein
MIAIAVVTERIITEIEEIEINSSVKKHVISALVSLFIRADYLQKVFFMIKIIKKYDCKHILYIFALEFK